MDKTIRLPPANACCRREDPAALAMHRRGFRTRRVRRCMSGERARMPATMTRADGSDLDGLALPAGRCRAIPMLSRRPTVGFRHARLTSSFARATVVYNEASSEREGLGTASWL